LTAIRVSGLRGKGLPRVFFAPFMLTVALLQALGVLLRLRPLVVLGMGGFAAGPGGLAAWLLRRPLLIHEQNSVPGLTNRLLAPLARVVLEGFPGSLPAARHAVAAGNPVRADIATLAPPEMRFAARSGTLRLLVIGGSLGAQALNQVVPQAIARLPAAQRPQVHHQTGQAQVVDVQQSYRDLRCEARVEAFIEDMAAAYAWADLVVCRSGALTVAELAAAGVAAILVPYPHATDDHQTGNARYLADAGAALLVPQDSLSAAWLAATLSRFTGQRETLLAMAHKARELARPDAARRVALSCLQAAGITPSVPSEGMPQ
jgi:UDP-N-acetylglucosamine--N-acetylmuramyl-(pentapeptide) pyrophosphoryl-undecaprenol N-acetylglucosamine transferase